MYVDIISRSIRSGIDFENAIVSSLQQLGIDAHRVGNHDNGVDIIADIVIDGYTYSFNIQCKYYNKSVGKHPIQEVYTGTDFYSNGGKPVLITNNLVTADARSYAKQVGVEIIANGEWQEIKQVQDTKKIINPNVHHGLMGIMLARIVEDDNYLIESIADETTQGLKQISDKEQLKIAIINDFNTAKEYSKVAAELSQQAAHYQQKVLDLQKAALLRNLDYG